MNSNVLEIDKLLEEREQRFRREKEVLDKQHEKDVKALDDEYQHDKAALLRVRELALGRPGGPTAALPSKPQAQPIAGRLAPMRSGKKTDRQIIREFLAGWTGTFTIPDLMAAAQRSDNKEAAGIIQNVWSSTMFWLVQNGLVKVAEPRKGNKPGKYRVAVSPEEMIAPKRRPQKNAFPLQMLVYEGIKRITQKRFGRKELTEFLQREHPEYAERLTPDLVGASLYRLFNEKKALLKCVEKSKQGNIYEKQ